MPIVHTPLPPTDEAEGYYVERAQVIETAGQRNFDVDFNLDNTAVIADEAVVQRVFDKADDYVDERAIVLGVTKDPDAAGDHYVHTTDKIFLGLRSAASDYAVVKGHRLRGVTNEQTDQAEGQFENLFKDAVARIDELLGAKRLAQTAEVGQGGISVVAPAGHPCGIRVICG